MKIFDPKLTGSIEILNTIQGNVTIAGGLNVEGSLGGAVTASATASYVEFDNIANKPTLISSSIQIASDISGSTTLLSSSIASDRLKNTTDTLDGDLTVTGKITAQEFHTEFVSASIIYESGSTQFGNSLDDTHIFTGSVELYSSGSGAPTLKIGPTFTFSGKGDEYLGQIGWNRDVTTGAILDGNYSAFQLHNYSGSLDLQVYASNGSRLTSHKFAGTKKVGINIGNNFPISALHVKQTGDTYNDGIKLEKGTGGNTYSLTVGSDNKLYLGIGTTSTISPTDALVVTLDGNVGIGTISPFSGTKLDVWGDLTLMQQNWALRGNNANADFAIEELIGSSFSDANVKFYIKSGGNVGINNTNPLGKLQITSGDSGASGAWTNADELILESDGNAGLAFQTPNTGAATIAFQDPESVQAGFIQYLHADNALRFATNGNNIRAVINSNGNLGIGTTDPQFPLHVVSTGIAEIEIKGNPPEFDLYDTAGTVDQRRARVTIDDSQMRFESLNDADNTVPYRFMAMDLTNGYVGIGTTTLSTKLTVAGDVTIEGGSSTQLTVKGLEADIWMTSTGGGAGTWRLLGSTGGSTKKFRIYDENNDADRFNISSAGEVTLPSQPRFLARVTTTYSGYNATSIGDVVIAYNETLVDIGSNFNTSTGKFTVPIDGYYFFAASAYGQTGAQTFDGWSQGWLVVNGGRRLYTDAVYQSNAQPVITTFYFTEYLAANDTVGVHFYNSTNSNINIVSNVYHTWFRGYLLG